MCKLAELTQEVMVIKVAQHQFREGFISEKKAKLLIMKAVFNVTRKEQSQWD